MHSIIRLLSFISILCLAALEIVSADLEVPIARPGCFNTCAGSLISIPYPFGIGPDCYLDPWFEITCNFTSAEQRPFLKKLNLEVSSLSGFDLLLENFNDQTSFGLAVLSDNWHTVCTSGEEGHSSSQQIVSNIDLEGSPFTFSVGENVLVMFGCPGHATITDRTSSSEMGGCSSVCPANSTVSGMNSDDICDGVGCCSAQLSSQATGINFYKINLTHIPADTCAKVALMDKSETGFIRLRNFFHVNLNWMPPPLVEGNIPKYQNTSNTICFQHCDLHGDGCYKICGCRDGYFGNPYLPYGCQDSCTEGNNHSIRCKKTTFAALLGVSICVGSAILLFCGYSCFRILRRYRQIKQRAKFFKRNGGLLLEQQMSSAHGFVDKTKVFTANELEKATDGFDTNRILGQGGQGTVYKGMLQDGRLVAIKKPKKVDKSQLQHFINEVVILSQINHRNVVKLLGCCLETEAPLLVYEYISNGTLSQHIHDPSEDFHITWKMRLQIAAESAGAIAYLHSASATPIYHRDIKSSNILLDERYRAKVSDFGVSRTITIDQTHLTTGVQGTFGYLDPEYFRSNQFTEKSDVYSFGVVLIELLTSKKPLTPTETGGCKSLAVDFQFNMENSSLFDMLDTRVVQEAKEEELAAVASLAMQCLNMYAKQRPPMKQVAAVLERIRSPNLPSVIEQTQLAGDNMVVEMSCTSSDCTSSGSFFYSDAGIGTSYSVEIQYLVHNTL